MGIDHVPVFLAGRKGPPGCTGFVANEALADKPGVDGWTWQARVREFRALMIE